MIARHGPPEAARTPARFAGPSRALRSAAFAVLLAAMAAQLFIAELGFRTSSLNQVQSIIAAKGEKPLPPLDRMEAARVTFAVVILAAVALWLVAGAVSGGTIIHHAWLSWPILAFVVLSLLSTLGASDKRAAWTGWLEQASLLAACWLAVQMCAGTAGKRRFAMLVVLLAALGVTLAGKGLEQYFVDIPNNVAFLEAETAKGISPTGAPRGSPTARLFEARVRNTSPTGYIALSNVFASTLLVMLGAAFGLAAEKLSAARRSRREWSKTRKKGEVHAPTLAAAITVACAAAIPVVLALTASRGASLGAALAAGGALAIWSMRRRLARRWRRTVVAIGLIFLLGLASVAGFGLVRDRLPTKTMTFRWYYWTASAEIVRDRPWLGVGPGNFPAHYLMHRRAAGEEEVKTPHDFIVHALVQYGFIGGACYLLVLALVLVGASRPGKREKLGDTPTRAPPARSVLWWVLVPVVSVGVVRAVFTIFGLSADGLLLEVVIPAGVLAAMIAQSLWAGGRLRDGLSVPTNLSRIVLAVGLVAFVLHNLVTFSLWTPAAATLFWVSAGACLSRAGGGKRRRLGRMSVPIAVVAAGAAVAAGIVFCTPVWRRSIHIEAALGALQSRPADVAAAVGFMEQASRDDPLDAITATDAARLSAQTAPPNDRAALRTALSRADTLAAEAIRRNPLRSASWLLLGRLNWYRTNPGLMKAGRRAILAPVAGKAILEPSWTRPMRRAIAMNPMALRLRLEFARMLFAAGAADECLEQLRQVEWIDSHLMSGSVMRLSARERREIARMRETMAASPAGGESSSGL